MKLENLNDECTPYDEKVGKCCHSHLKLRKKKAIENISSVKKLMKIEYDAQPITMRKKERKG
jgi:hypothetical protein